MCVVLLVKKEIRKRQNDRIKNGSVVAWAGVGDFDCKGTTKKYFLID